jgi:hypothetical protein
VKEMGLDTYASRRAGDVELTEEDEAAFAEAGLELCGGILSGDGGSSFRGKVYADVVQRVADVSLYQEWIPPERVRAMWEAFERVDETVVATDSADDRYPTTEEEFEQLRAFLRICVEHGLGLVGWW